MQRIMLPTVATAFNLLFTLPSAIQQMQPISEAQACTTPSDSLGTLSPDPWHFSPWANSMTG
jgi:hypothetical protein